MMEFLKIIDKLLAWISIGIIRVYQWTLSPDMWILSPLLKGEICTHEPHCSAYGIQVLQRYWFRHWLPKLTDRILSCKTRNKKMYDPDHYRIVFFSSAEIGVPFLEQLYNDKRFEIVWVVTQEDKPVWRWLKITPNIIKTKALELWIANENIYTPTKIHPDKSLEGKHFNDWLIEKAADFYVVIAYGKILPQVILDIPIFWAINVHGSLLPKYRWASPLQTVFLNKDEVSWITIMHMDEGMDTWNIIDKLAFKIPFEWTVKDLIESFKEKGTEFLNDTLWDYWKGMIKEQEQDENKANYCKKIVKEDWKIDPYTLPLDEVYAKYRWYFLWPKIRFTINDKKVGIEEIIIDEVKFLDEKDTPLLTKDNNLNKAIKQIVLKPEGKKGMDFKSFKNGYLK